MYPRSSFACLSAAVFLAILPPVHADPTVQAPGATGSITGTVLFSTTNKPVPGIEVAVTQGPQSIGGTEADKAGAFSLTTMPPGTYTLTPYDYKDLFKDWVEQPQNVEVDAGVKTTDVKLYLVRGGVITGKITDSVTGRPVPNITVTTMQIGKAMASGTRSVATSGPDGTYSLRILPDNVSVVLWTRGQNGAVASQDVEVAEGETKSVDFKIKTPIPLAAVHGIVIGSNGKPVASATVTVQNPNAFPQTYTTNALGRFTVDAPGLVTGASLQAQAHTVSGDLGTANVYTYKGENQVSLHITAGALCTFKGRVVDQDGKPVPNAAVVLAQFSGNFHNIVGQTQCDSHGQYAFPANLGSFTYSIQANQLGYATGDSAKIYSAAGQIVQLPDIQLKRANNFTGGTVVNTQGNPVPNVKVYIYNVPNASTTTDKAGHFTIKGVPDGTITANVTTSNNNFFSQQIEAGKGDNVFYVK